MIIRRGISRKIRFGLDSSIQHSTTSYNLAGFGGDRTLSQGAIAHKFK